MSGWCAIKLCLGMTPGRFGVPSRAGIRWAHPPAGAGRLGGFT